MAPTPRRSCPSAWDSLARLLVDFNAVAADLHGLTTVTLVRRHAVDAAVAVPVVVPVHK